MTARQVGQGGPQSVKPDGFYTRSEAAELIGRKRDTLKRWHISGRYRARYFMNNGKVQTWLYDDDDIKALRELKKTVRPGRPPKDA